MTTMMFYDNLDLLEANKYRDKKIERISDYSFASAANSLPVTLAEFLEASKEYILAFVKNDEGEYFPVVALGVEELKNLYVSENGEWNAHYIPGYVRRYPFASLMNKDEDKFNICIDESYPGLGTEKGQALFLEDGSPAPLVEDVIKMLQDYHSQMQHTVDFCKRLAEHELLEHRELKAKANRKEGEKMFQISGLYVVNEEKLRNLDSEIVLNFFSKGELAWIYCHLISLSNFPRLLDRYFETK